MQSFFKVMIHGKFQTPNRRKFTHRLAFFFPPQITIKFCSCAYLFTIDNFEMAALDYKIRFVIYHVS